MKRKVQRVVDGDTFQVRRNVNGSQYIRIAKVNHPERGEYGYAAAKQRLARLVGKDVTLKPVGRSYGRTVAVVRHNRRLVR